MTQHTPSNNRSTNTTNNNVSYSQKIRGTHTRVSRVRVTTVGKAPFPEKQHRSCPRCKDSTNSMKILNARVGRIEQLVDGLAKTTRGLASMSKRNDRFAQNALKFRGIDLTRCTLQELQKLVVATTNVMVPSNNINPTIKPTSNPNDMKLTNTKDTTCSEDDTADTIDTKKSIPAKDKDNTLSEITNSEKKIYHSEPVDMEDVKIIPSYQNAETPKISSPIKTVMGSLKIISRHDSGYAGS
ncbi:unnamed protein product [Rhizophagus irregularis]|uniref:Uncharacterized protein n=1 Tax=Rhizophagus irregularis TaxID=588596 RepID=A0A2N1N0X2_9GLOM|nr:hypothetical protein RhiirC2_751669 [Rhizophagus irregularis]CAB4396580.1 unnamed protein product [Rhizophagus irregularis]CAB5388220.1 unnamed protein product [Rhizophagus irregularis]